jgi:penicillin-binding protein 2
MYAFRLKAVMLVLGLALALLAAGLFQLQIVEGSRYREEARLRLRRDPGFYPAKRGSIFDRAGVVLAQDTGAYDVAIYYPFIELDDRFVAKMARQWGVSAAEVHDRIGEMWPQLERLTGVTEQELDARVWTIIRRVNVIRKTMDDYYGHEVRVRESTYGEKTSVPHTLVHDVDLATVGAISSRPEEFPGLTIQTASRREYMLGAVAPHIIGRLGEVTREDIEGAVNPNGTVRRQSINARYPVGDLKRYLPGDLIGREGIEGAYEQKLHGSRGQFRKGIDGNFLEDIEAVKGEDMQLTLDVALQADVEAILDAPPDGVNEGKPVIGAAVVIDCETGEILVLATGPRFNPQTFREDYNSLKVDEDSPLFNRALQGQYPLGSVFKAVTAIAGLHENVMPATFTCHGMLDPAHPTQFRDDNFIAYGTAHGTIGMHEAIKESCNAFFCNVGRLLGTDHLQQYADLLGFGRPTGIGLGEASGQINEKDARNLAIGQGRMLVTPVQVAQLYGQVATYGRMPALSLVRDPAHPPVPRDLGLNPVHMDKVRKGFWAVVNEPGGTGYKTVRLPDIQIAGKTGTAQVGGGQPPHAWFAGYAPANHPRVAVAVIVEHGGHGGTTAGPLAREIIRACQKHGYLSDGPVERPVVASPDFASQPTAPAPLKPLG